MIDINLIPPDARKKNVSSLLTAFSLGLPQQTVLVVVTTFVGILLLVHIYLGGLWVVTEISLLMQRAQWQKVLPDKQRIDNLGNEIKEAKKKTDSLAEITSPKSMGWARKFNILSDAITNGLWLRRLSLDGKALVIEGTVLAKNQNEVALVNAFVQALKKEDFFMQDVSGIEVGNIQRAKKGATDVAHFTLTVKIK